MRYLASRLALVASLLFLNLWIGSSLLGTWALALGDFGLAASVGRPAWTTDLPLFGFLGLVIFGIAEHFVPLFAGRELRSPRLATAQIGLAIASVVLSLASSRFLVVGRLLWFAASALFVGLVFDTIRSGRRVPRPGDREGRDGIDRPAATMTYVACLYLLVTSAGLALAAPGGRVLVPALAGYGSSLLHLYALGFITLALFGLVFHLVPRFLEVIPSARWVRVLAGLGIPSPVGVALLLPYAGTDDPRRFLLTGFAAVEGVAAVLFASLVIGMWRRSGRHRPAALFSALGSLWLILGAVIGVFMAASSGAVARWAPAHAWIMVLGFAGFETFGITHEILLPYVTKGSRAWRVGARAHEVLAAIGLALVVISSVLAMAGYPRSSAVLAVLGLSLLVAMSLSVAVGTFQTVRAISKPTDMGGSRP